MTRPSPRKVGKARKQRATKRKATVRVVKPGAFAAPSVTTTTAGNWSSCWYVPSLPRKAGARRAR